MTIEVSVREGLLILSDKFVNLDLLHELSEEAQAIELTDDVDGFIENASDFIENYLPLDRNCIKNVLVVSFHRISGERKLSLSDLGSHTERKKMQQFVSSLKRSYSEILQNQDPIVDIAIDGLLNKITH